jgi:hypothetical protein
MARAMHMGMGADMVLDTALDMVMEGQVSHQSRCVRRSQVNTSIGQVYLFNENGLSRAKLSFHLFPYRYGTFKECGFPEWRSSSGFEESEYCPRSEESQRLGEGFTPTEESKSRYRIRIEHLYSLPYASSQT